MSNGAKKYGLEFDRQRNFTYPYYEQELEYIQSPLDVMKTGQESATEADQTPTDRDAARIRQYDAADFLARVQALAPIGVPGLTQVSQLPPVLASITGTYYKEHGTGFSNHNATDMSVDITNAGSGSLNPRSTAEASANIVGVLTYDLVDWYSKAVVFCISWEFTDVPGMSVANILTRLSALSGLQMLPVFKTQAHQITVLSGEVAIQQSADTDVNIAANFTAGNSSLSHSFGSGQSTKVGIQPRVETIPACIHGALTGGSGLPASDTETASVSVVASIPNIPATGSPIITAITNTPSGLNADATASFTPRTLGATTPSSIPVTGLYITAISAVQGELGTVDYRITVVDFSQYA